MALTVATNTGALMAQAAASSVNKEMEISMERLATGKRINGASDDAAGVAIASRLTSEIKGTNQAIRNAMDGQALIDTAEGAHQEIENILQRMREIAVQSRNDTNDADDRANLQLEIDSLTTEINRIADTTSWAGKKLLTGNGNTGASSTDTFTFQVGASSASDNRIDAQINAMTAAALGVGAGNASVGANGATMVEVGENVLQISGSPVAGDVYNFNLNGTSYSLKLVADGSNFDYDLATDGAYAGTVAVAGGSQSGTDKGAVAEILAVAINALTDHPGLSATSNTDGSVTLTQGIDMTGTTANDGTTVTTVAKVASGTTATIGGESFVSGDDQLYTLDVTSISEAESADDIIIKINGVELSLDAAVDNDAATIDGAFSATDGFANTSYGFAAQLQNLADNSALLKGITIKIEATDANTLRIGVKTSPSSLISSESVDAANSTNAVDVTTASGIDAAVTAIDGAIKLLNNQRASLGSISNRLDSTVSNLTNISSNLQAGRGRIEDADFAAETTSLAKSQILQQASTAMLAQANASKQNVLSLLQG